MSVTAEVFQDPMGSSKEVSANSRDILVTLPTSQWAMSPYLEIRPGLSSVWDVQAPTGLRGLVIKDQTHMFTHF